MAVMDAVSVIASVAASAYLDFQPASGVEWIIHNCGSEGTADLYKYDGTNNVLCDSSSGSPSYWTNMFLHCKNNIYYRLRNTATSAKLMHFDGVVSKG